MWKGERAAREKKTNVFPLPAAAAGAFNSCPARFEFFSLTAERLTVLSLYASHMGIQIVFFLLAERV